MSRSVSHGEDSFAIVLLFMVDVMVMLAWSCGKFCYELYT